MKKSLITGITGFAGSHLAELLLEEGFEVYGTTRPRSKTENIDHIKNQIFLFDADLLDSHSLYHVVKKVKPDFIFHLAAQSFVPTSWASPANTLEINVVGSVHLFEAVRNTGISPRIQIACSSEEYGLVKENELPVSEKNPLRPLSPYAVSKVAMDYLGYQYYRSYALEIIRTRAFNHTGPRRGEQFVCSNFAKQIVEIEKQKKEPVIFVGDLTTQRDFSDVRDIVRAYLVAIQRCQPGEVYNIASGVARKIEDVLNLLLSKSLVKDIKIKKDPSRMRPSDVPILRGDATEFRRATNWKPKIPFEKTLEDLLNYWRDRL